MGHFNGRKTSSDLLNMNTCIVCQKPGAKQSLLDLQTTTFDYVCTVCNPNVTISVTDIALGTDLLIKLRDNLKARNNLKEEISSYKGDVFKMDVNILQYFLGQVNYQSITYADWILGNITGDIRKWTEIAQEDLSKIQGEQKKIFYVAVAEKLNILKNLFSDRKKNSINPKQMIINEMNDIQNIIIKDRYQFQGKPVANEVITIGSYSFRTLSIFYTIQDMYSKAIGGTLDLGIVPSQKQKLAVAALNAKVDCMVQAVAFGQFLEFLQELQKPREDDNSSKFDGDRLKDLEKKIDDLRDLIIKQFEENEDTHYHLLYTLQSGQEVIHSEFEDIKTLLPNLSKKNLKEVVKGKLYDLMLKKLLSKEVFDFIMEKLNKVDLNLLDNIKQILS